MSRLEELLGSEAPAVLAALEGAPPSAGEGLVRILERAAEPESLLAGLSPAELRRVAWVVGIPGAPVEAFLADPRDLPAAAGEQWLGGGDEDEETLAQLPPDPLDALRVRRRRATLSLGARELTGELSAPAAAYQMSALADRCLETALELAGSAVASRFPTAPTESVVVLALGKLGGRELNYSSDVDLVLVRADDADRRAAEALGREFVNQVQRASAFGRLFRVDLRLRPYGKSGELIPRERAVVSYLLERGRTWERQAWLRARVVAGDAALGERVLGGIEGWLWRDLSARAIREVVGSREQIVEHTRDADSDVKHGPGGLRDVEFAVQFLQLLHGGRKRSIRTTNTLEGVARLAQAELLTTDEAAGLRESYAFLRRLEHLLQLTTDRELTRLPLDDERLAACLGLTPTALCEAFRATQARARELLDRLLNRPFASGGSTAELEVQDLLLSTSPDPQAAKACLERYGFSQPKVAWRTLEALGVETSMLLSPSGRARAVLAGLAPRLLEAIAARPEPDRVLRNCERVLGPLGAKATVFQLLSEAPDLLDLLVHLAAGSEVLVTLLANHPGVFDEVIDGLLRRRRLGLDEVERMALASKAPKRLRELRALGLLLVAIPDLAGRSNLQNTSRGLADLSEGFLRAFVRRAQDEAEARHGGAPEGGSLLVFALGGMGARELSYASDADLVFVYEGGAPAPDGASAARFWGEVVQQVIALGESEGSAEGPLLAVDLRLRPGGGKSPLAQRWSAVADYLRGTSAGGAARDFERLAWQKARAVCGDPERAEALSRELAELLYAHDYDPSALWREVADMTGRQRAATTREDLKRGPGSLSALELVAGALALTYGNEHPTLRVANTAHLLDGLEEAGLVSASAHQAMRTAYAFLRRVVLRLRARRWAARPELPEGAELRGLALDLGYVDTPGKVASAHFRQELSFARDQIEAFVRARLADAGV